MSSSTVYGLLYHVNEKHVVPNVLTMHELTGIALMYAARYMA